jgi:predicted RNase H-like HicB family nuclease
MNIQRPKNTKERGTIECLVYKEGNTDAYIGVCLTFDIVEEGKNPVELMKSIREAAELHLETVIRENLPDELLNRYAPEEYWLKYFEAAKQIGKNSVSTTNNLVVSPYYRSLTAQIA